MTSISGRAVTNQTVRECAHFPVPVSQSNAEEVRDVADTLLRDADGALQEAPYLRYNG